MKATAPPTGIERFVDVQRLVQEHPHAFDLPGPDELAAIRPGNYAKVCAAPERFWVVVTAISDDGTITGTVDNDLICTARHGIVCGDEVTFERRHVYDLMERGPDGGTTVLRVCPHASIRARRAKGMH